MSRFVHQRKLTPAALGLDAVTLAAERTSSVIDLTGASRLALYFDFTRSAYTAIAISVDFCPDEAADYAQYFEQSVSIASGTATMSDFSFARTISASKKLCLRLKDLDAVSAKIRVSATAGGASDLVTVKAIVSED